MLQSVGGSRDNSGTILLGLNLYMADMGESCNACVGESKDNACSIIFGFNFYKVIWEKVPPVGSVVRSKCSACTIVNQITFSLGARGWRGVGVSLPRPSE